MEKEEETGAKEEKKDVYVLIKVKPKYVEEFCIMMLACKGLCKRACKSKNLAEIDKVFSVLGPYDFLLELSGKGKDEEEMDKKINRTIFKIRETLGNYIDETCTLTQFKLSELFTKEEARKLFPEAKLLETKIKKEDELNDFREFLEKEGIFGRLKDLQQELDCDTAQNRWEINKCLFSLKRECTKYLKEGIVDDKLKKEFEGKKQPLSDKAKVSKIDEKNWKIVDGTVRYGIYDTGVQQFILNTLNIYKIKTKDVHVLIKVKPEYTEEFFVAMTVIKSLCNRATPSQNLAKIDEVCSTLGPFDFLLKIIGEGKEKEEERMHEKINKTILEIRETLGGYINETLTLKKFKIPMTKEELEKLFEKILKEKSLAKLPGRDGEKVPKESHKPDAEIDLKEIYDAETTSLKSLLKKAKTFLEPEDLNKRIDELTNRVDKLEKRS
jgi:hypothetical protein